jgi:para-nitrobenzyl esterase
LYHGESFAHSGVVYVSVNYRLGSLGFLELGHLDPALSGSGNVGLLDQVEALRWVAENISDFGGDPGNVTIFGESAGAMSVSTLLTMPSARGLFHKAITQSGALSAAKDPEHAAITTDEFMGLAGLGTVEELQAVPVTDLLAAHAKMSAARIADPDGVIKRDGSPLAFLPFRPVADGHDVPTDPLAEVAAGRAAKVPLVVGTNLEEWKLFALMTQASADREALSARVRLLGADPEEVIVAYESDHPGATIAELETAMFTDAVFRVPASRLADAHVPHAPVWQYRFDWRSPAMGGMLGAAHALEIPFVFDMVTDHRLHVMVGPEAPETLAHSMHEAWVSFARDGSPRFRSLDWPAISVEERPVLCLGDDSSVQDDPLATSRRCWSG